MKYKTNPGVILTSIVDSYFLVSIEKTIRVNETVAFYWKQLERSVDENELAACAIEYYEIQDYEKLKIDIKNMLNSFLEMHFIERLISE